MQMKHCMVEGQVGCSAIQQQSIYCDVLKCYWLSLIAGETYYQVEQYHNECAAQSVGHQGSKTLIIL